MNEITEKQWKQLQTIFEFKITEDGWAEIVGMKKENSLEVGKLYKFTLRQYLVNEPKNFSLSTNWNHGERFKSTIFYGVINQLMGKMINCTGNDDLGNEYGSMWIPKGSIEQWEEVI